jgi:hypothetical protein
MRRKHRKKNKKKRERRKNSSKLLLRILLNRNPNKMNCLGELSISILNKLMIRESRKLFSLRSLLKRVMMILCENSMLSFYF